MKTYTTLRNLYGSLTNDAGATNLTLGDQLINDGIREFVGSVPGYYLEESQDITMVADTQFYNLNNNFGKLRTVKKTIGTTVYTLKEINSLEKWNMLNQSSATSTIPESFFILENQIGFYPIPSDTNTVTVYYEKNFKDLSVADYTTQTTLAITSGSATITGTGTTWVADMVGRYLRITPPAGDGQWYKIKTFTSTTVLVLDRVYMGTTIAASSCPYIIGEVPVIPEAYHIAPVYYAVGQYWHINGQPVRAREYERRFNELIDRAKKDVNSQSTSPVIDDSPITITNPNLTIEL